MVFTQLVVEGVEPFRPQEMVDPLTPLATEVSNFAVLLSLDDHHRLVKFQMTVRARYFGQNETFHFFAKIIAKTGSVRAHSPGDRR
jgi:hypothetical protein